MGCLRSVQAAFDLRCLEIGGDSAAGLLRKRPGTLRGDAGRGREQQELLVDAPDCYEASLPREGAWQPCMVRAEPREGGLVLVQFYLAGSFEVRTLSLIHI